MRLDTNLEYQKSYFEDEKNPQKRFALHLEAELEIKTAIHHIFNALVLIPMYKDKESYPKSGYICIFGLVSTP